MPHQRQRDLVHAAVAGHAEPGAAVRAAGEAVPVDVVARLAGELADEGPRGSAVAVAKRVRVVESGVERADAAREAGGVQAAQPSRATDARLNRTASLRSNRADAGMASFAAPRSRSPTRRTKSRMSPRSTCEAGRWSREAASANPARSAGSCAVDAWTA